MKYIVTDYTVPYYNMALEEYILTNDKFDDEYVFFYVHRPSVIIGKFQNAASETDMKFMEENNIILARRISGGGAVYHDEGNLNFSFICHKKTEGIDFEPYLRPVVDAVRKMGIDATLSGRNDLLAGGRKFGGNAQHISGNKVLCHGTLMVNVNLDILDKVLDADPEKYITKGISSVRSRVVNLSEFSCDITVEKLKKNILDELAGSNGLEEYHLSEEDLASVESLVAENFSTWEYNFGGKTAFSVTKKKKLPAGLISISYDAKGGIISGISITGDFFADEDVSCLEKALVGTKLIKEDLVDAVKPANVISGVSAEEITEIILY